MMKRSFILSSLVIGLLLVSASCSNPVKQAQKQAQKEIKTEKSALLGKYPSLYQQKSAALDNLDLIYDRKEAEIGTNEKDEYFVEIKKLEVEKRESENEIEDFYDSKMKKELRNLDGQEIPVKVDSNYYSAGSATLHCDDERGKIYFHINVTLAPKNKINWEEYGNNLLQYMFIDENDNVLYLDEFYSRTVESDQKFQKGDTKGDFFIELYNYYLPDLTEKGIYLTCKYKD